MLGAYKQVRCYDGFASSDDVENEQTIMWPRAGPNTKEFIVSIAGAFGIKFGRRLHWSSRTLLVPVECTVMLQHIFSGLVPVYICTCIHTHET